MELYPLKSVFPDSEVLLNIRKWWLVFEFYDQLGKEQGLRVQDVIEVNDVVHPIKHVWYSGMASAGLSDKYNKEHR